MPFLNCLSYKGGGRSFLIFAPLALAFGGILGVGPALAQEVECSAIMNDVKAGKLYAVTVLKKKDQVKIETVKGSCFESIDTWNARGLPMASLGSGALIPPPKKKKKQDTPPPPRTYSGVNDEKNAPPPTSSYSGSGKVLPPPENYTPGQAPKQAPVQAPGPADGQAEGAPGGAPQGGDEAITKSPGREGRCDRNITDYWGPGEIDVKGSPYWLSGAFTVDMNGDGWVDNVGFKLKVIGRVGNVIRYFDTPGRLSGQSIPDLKLNNDNDISRICSANITFELPKPVVPEEEKKAEKKPDLPPEYGKKEPQKENPAEDPKKKKKGPSTAAMIVISSAGVVLFLSGIATLFLLQPELAARRKKKDKKEKEDDENDEESEEKKS